MKAERDAERERALALAWHSAHFLMAAIGLGWSLYFWNSRRRKLVETRPR
jgi:hypothetical protein